MIGISHAGGPDLPGSAQDIKARLSAREYEVFIAMAHGQTRAAIAKETGLSASTVTTYRRRIFSKLHVTSNAGLALAAQAAGLVHVRAVKF